MVHSSAKVLGKYEEPLMERLCAYFEPLGFATYPHASLNFAWHGALSDVDVLMIKDNKLYGVEIKSNHDNVKRANKQLEELSHYVDYCYLATEKMPKRPVKNAGQIIIDDWGVRVIKEAPFVDNFSFRAFRRVKRTCFNKVFSTSRYGDKYDVAEKIWNNYKDKEVLKQIFRRILLCSAECNKCPLRPIESIPINQLSLVHFYGGD